VPPLIKRFLDHLDVWSAFTHNHHCPSFRTISAWGGPELIGNEFFLDVHNTGWRLDRALFDRMLATEAENHGALPMAAKVRALRFDEGLWNVDCGEAGTHTARCVVDATGRSALLSRLAGLKLVNDDRLVASAVFFEESGHHDGSGTDGALVESFIDGWWYTAATPRGHRVAVLMTDADIARHLAAASLDAWMEHLGKTRHIQNVIGAGRPLAPPKLWPASSRYLDGTFPSGMIAVGDAVSCFDPLSSQGIIKALRSAIFASYAIAEWLSHSDEHGFAKYETLMKREFVSYRKTLHDYYFQEQRWPEAPFWHRRHIRTDTQKFAV
jgi:flavin-dependent dehydrogenase